MRYFRVHWSNKKKSKYMLILDENNNKWRWSDMSNNHWQPIANGYFEEGIKEGRFVEITEKQAFIEML